MFTTVFQNVALGSGIKDQGASWSAAWGQVNSDLYPDLWLNNHLNPGSLYLNQGGRSFRNIADEFIPQSQQGGDTHGAAWADFDRDGDDDLLQVVGAQGGKADDPNLLYRNEPNGFSNIASELGLSDAAARSRTPLWFDYDRDGRLDLLVSAVNRENQTQPNLFRQTPTGFQVVNQTVQFQPPNQQATPYAMISDLTGDGVMELIYKGGGETGLTIYDTRQPQFKEITEALLPNFPRTNRDVEDDIAIGDFNGDRLPDLYITRNGIQSDAGQTSPTTAKARFILNQNRQGLEFQTPGEVKFTFNPFKQIDRSQIFIGSTRFTPSKKRFTLSPENPLVRGLPTIPMGIETGVFIGYFPQSKRWSLQVLGPQGTEVGALIQATTPISKFREIGFNRNEMIVPDLLYFNTGNGFQERGDWAGINQQPIAGTNVASGDFDNDGDLDLYIVASGSAVNRPNVLYENQGNGQFTQANHTAMGSGHGRGDAIALADYDLNGFLDLLITNGNWAPVGGKPGDDGPIQLFQNQGNDHHWLQIDLKGTVSNANGIGSTATVTTDRHQLMREQNGGIHNRTQNFQRLHFGLAQAPHINKLKVDWSRGITQITKAVAVNQRITVVEGEGAERQDIIRGSRASDRLLGKGGRDRLVGQSGNDRLIGGAGNDTLRGGPGRDQFVFEAPHQGVDTIEDFRVGVDTLILHRNRFRGDLSRGPLTPTQFRRGSRAQDRRDRLLFSPFSRQLFFDRDGNGAAHPILLGIIQGSGLLKFSDVQIE